MKFLIVPLFGLLFFSNPVSATEFSLSPFDDASAFQVAVIEKLGVSVDGLALKPKKDIPGSVKAGECIQQFCGKGFSFDKVACKCVKDNICETDPCTSPVYPLCQPSEDGYSRVCLCSGDSCGAGKTCVGGQCVNCTKGTECNCPAGKVSDGNGGCYTPKNTCNPNPCPATAPTCSAISETAYSCSCTSTSCGEGKSCNGTSCDNCAEGEDCGCSYYGKVADGAGGCKCSGNKIDDGAGGCKCPAEYESDGQGGCILKEYGRQCVGNDGCEGDYITAAKTFTSQIGTITMGTKGGIWCRNQASEGTSLNFNGSYWVGPDAHLGGGVRISGNAVVYQGARAYRATQIYDNAQIFGHAILGDDSPDDCGHGTWSSSDGSPKVYGNAKVHGKALVYDNSEVYGDAEIYGNAKVHGNGTKVYGNAKICGDTDFTGTLSTCDKRYCSDCP